MIKELTDRGVLAAVTGAGELEDIFERGVKLTVYCGFDPTADSLHIGNMLPLVNMKRFMDAGHTVIALVGGATGAIGDPSGKSTERNLIDLQTIEGYKAAITKQIRSFLGEGVVVVDNLDWAQNYCILDFFRDVGKYFSVNEMMAKESVRRRFDSGAEGISFTEFCYQIIQGLDFYHLKQAYGCSLQIGGSDQMGNITAGTSLIHKKMGHSEEAFGLTTKLLTTSNGQKFGKSEGNAVWLDPQKTSPFDFYQFWLNVEDEEVYKLLNFFSMKSPEEVEAIRHSDSLKKGAPSALRLLAEEMTLLVHGEAGLKEAQDITQALVSGDFSALSPFALEEVVKGLECATVSLDETLSSALLKLGMVSSKSQAKTLLSDGAITINGVKEKRVDRVLDDADFIHETYCFLKKGKRDLGCVVLG